MFQLNVADYCNEYYEFSVGSSWPVISSYNGWYSHNRGVRASVRKSLKKSQKSEIILNAWKGVLFNALNVWKWGFVKSKSKSEIRLKSEFSHPYHKESGVKQSVKVPSKQSPFFVPGIINPTTVQVISNASGYLWPCITKPTKSRMAQFCVMARNRVIRVSMGNF